MRRASQGPEPSIWVGARSLPEASATIGATLALVRRKLPFLALWIAGFVVCGVVYSKIVRQDFIATTQILLQPRVIVNDGPEDLRHFHQFMIDGEQCETELRVLRSEQLLYRVFKTLDIVKSPEIRNGPDGFWSYLGSRVDKIENLVTPGHETLQAFYAFAGRVRSRRLGLSYVIEISYRAQSAEQAVRVVNSIASAYAVYRLRGALARIQRQGVYLEGRLAKLQEQMMIADAGMRFGTIPDVTLPDAEVRLLGPAGFPLRSIYPKMTPILMLSVLFGGVSGLLIVLMPYAGTSARIPRPSTFPTVPEHMRIA